MDGAEDDAGAIRQLILEHFDGMRWDSETPPDHTCDTGSAAIGAFRDLVSQEKNPIVLLDFMLPDMDAHSVLTQILQIQPNARIVLETATEKDDEGIKELIRLEVSIY